MDENTENKPLEAEAKESKSKKVHMPRSRMLRVLIRLVLILVVLFGLYMLIKKVGGGSKNDTAKKTIQTDNYTSKGLAMFFVPKDKPNEAKEQNEFKVGDSIEIQYNYEGANETAFVSFHVINKADGKVVYSTNKIKLVPNEKQLKFPLSIPDSKPGDYRLETKITPDDKIVNELDFKLTN